MCVSFMKNTKNTAAVCETNMHDRLKMCITFLYLGFILLLFAADSMALKNL